MQQVQLFSINLEHAPSRGESKTVSVTLDRPDAYHARGPDLVVWQDSFAFKLHIIERVIFFPVRNRTQIGSTINIPIGGFSPGSVVSSP